MDGCPSDLFHPIYPMNFFLVRLVLGVHVHPTLFILLLAIKSPANEPNKALLRPSCREAILDVGLLGSTNPLFIPDVHA